MKLLTHIWDYITSLWTVKPDCCEDAALVSTCCCSMPYGNVHEFDGEHFGNCGRCKEHTDFEKEVCCGKQY